MIHDPELAHELRTPLHGILAAVALLEGTPLGDDQSESVETIREAAQALLALADDALAAARPDAARADSSCDPRRVVDGARRLLAESARAKRLTLAAAVDADVPASLRANPGQLRQVLVNLVGNALKFTALGGVSVRAQRAAPNDPRRVDDPELVTVVFEVTDTGPGLDAAQQALLFQPFSQPHASPHGDAPRGTGLGLAISAALVQRMGGTIGVRSEPGAGSTFWFTVTAWADAAVPEPRSEPRDRNSSIGTALPGGTKVLVVDDDPLGRRVTARLLERLGCHVDGADSIASASEALERLDYDLVLLDRQLPDGDGFDVAVEQRRREAGRAERERRTHIVALTANADHTTRDRCLAAGMDACLVKPAGIDELRHVLSRLPVPTAPAERRPTPPALDAVRLDTLARLDAEAPGLLAGVADDYARGAAERVHALRAAVCRGDLVAAARVAHALRGSSAAAGAPRAAALAADLERAMTGSDARARAVAPSLASVEALALAVDAAARELAEAARRAQRRAAATVAP
jgi:CheY-like chemotaxis protein